MLIAYCIKKTLAHKTTHANSLSLLIKAACPLFFNDHQHAAQRRANNNTGTALALANFTSQNFANLKHTHKKTLAW